MSERHPTPGPVEAGPLPPAEAHVWFPVLAAACATPTRPSSLSVPLTALLNGLPVPPFAPADAVFRESGPAEATALCAALACPDVYVIDAASGPDQLRLAANLALACRSRGERVLVLCGESIDADKLVVKLRDGGETSLLRALAPGEPANQLPAASAERVARAHGEQAVQRQRTALNQAARDAATRRDRLTQAEAAFTPAEAARARLAALPQSPDAALADRLNDAEARLAAARGRRVGLEAEGQPKALAGAAKPAGWVASVKRLFAADGGDTAVAAPPDTRLADLDREIASLQSEAEGLAAELAAATADLVHRRAAAEAEAAPALDAARTALEAAGITGAPDAAGLAEAVAAARRQADHATHQLESFEAAAPTLARQLIAAARVVVGPAAAVRSDAALQAPAAFDVAVVADAELFSEAELEPVWALAGRRVLLGDAAARFSTGTRRPAGPFLRLLHRLHVPALHIDHATMTARLLPTPADAAFDCEPLADQPEIELRFLRPAGPGVEPRLAQVTFPANFAVAAAKTFLARELGESFVRFAGTPAWTDAADHLEARVPGTPPGTDGVDLGGGVREELTGAAADCWTAAVRFDKAHGWTLDAAQARLAEMTPTPRAARLPRHAPATEYAPARRPAGVRG